MNIRSITLILAAALFIGAVVAHAAPNGPTSIRYSVDEAFVATGVDPDAAGRVQASERQDGGTGHKRLRVTVSHLNPLASYSLLARVGDDTNFVTVTNFTTTAFGRGGVSYRRQPVLGTVGL